MNKHDDKFAVGQLHNVNFDVVYWCFTLLKTVKSVVKKTYH